MRRIGTIKLLQVQRGPLKVKDVSYDPRPLLEVESASLGPDGMLGSSAGGWVLDVHSSMHPACRGGGNRALSIGFTAHYDAMSARYGARLLGEAGENIIVESSGMVTLADLDGTVVIKAAEGDVELTGARVAAPCREFTSYLLGLDHIPDRAELGNDLEFLGHGMRGFVFGLDHLGGWITVRTGDEVFGS